MCEKKTVEIVVLLWDGERSTDLSQLRKSKLVVECPVGWSPVLLVLREDTWRPTIPQPLPPSLACTIS